MSAGTNPPGGWYEDPRDANGLRYWDGEAWTERVKPSVAAMPSTEKNDAFGTPVNAGSAPSVVGDYRLSGWWARVGATLLDGLIVGVPTFLVGLATGLVKIATTTTETTNGTTHLTSHNVGAYSNLGFDLLYLVVFTAYCFVLMRRRGAHNGQTLGKQALGIKVVQNDGAPITPGTILIRETFFKGVLSPLTFGFFGLVDDLWPLPDGENRALHDHGAKTHVVVASSVQRTPPVAS